MMKVVLTMKPLEKNLFKLSWPIYVELLFFMLMGVVDTLMLSQYDDLSVAAVGNATRIINLFIGLLNVVALGVGIVVSQYIGAKQHQAARTTIKAGINTSAFIGISVMILIQFIGRSFFNLINTNASILEDALSYLSIVSFGLIFVGITQSISAGLKSYGLTKLIMVVVVTTNLLNIILNIFLIFGLWIFPELGVRGAAYATTISKFVTMLVALFFLYKRLKVWPFLLHLLPLKEHLVKIFKIGFPSAFEQFIYQLTHIFILSFLNSISVLAVTSHIYVTNITLPVLVFSLAVSQGNQVIVGWHVGAGDYQAAYRRTLRSMRIALVIVLILSVSIFVNAKSILSVFTDDADIIRMGKRALFIIIFLEIGRLSNLVVIQSLRAAGDVIYPAVIAAFSMLGIAVGLSYLFGIYFGLGIIGVFIGLAADECIRGLLVFIRWIRKTWVGKAVVKEKTMTIEPAL